MLPTDGVPVEAAVRDLDQQRRPAALEAGAHLFDDRGARVFVHFIHKNTGRTQPVELRCIRRDWTEERPALRVTQVVDRLYNPATKLWGCRDHPGSIRPHNLGLIPRGCGRKHLRTCLAIGRQAIQANAGRHGRLAVALADLEVGGVEPAIGADMPAEQGPHDELLPRLQPESLTCELSLGQHQHVFEKGDGAECRRRVPAQPPRGAGPAVPQVPLTGEAHQTTRRDLAGLYGVRVGVYRISQSRNSLSRPLA